MCTTTCILMQVHVSLLLGSDKDTDLIRSSVTWIALSHSGCWMEHIFFSQPGLLDVIFPSFLRNAWLPCLGLWFLFACWLSQKQTRQVDFCLLHILCGSYWNSLFSASTTIAELPCVFVQLFPSCRHRRTGVNDLTAGCCPVDPYVFTGMDQDYELCSFAFEKWMWYFCCIKTRSGEWNVLNTLPGRQH